ncbi:MAG: hypothetical protein PHP44_16065 [Kiritimatiellae bacterium]|nr:hypothetical protein [Kiritimatiellia bacterium]MDD4737615.1 hypothetical protein [Kiritimatiellia bacterium]
MEKQNAPYRWFSRGDINAFFALMPDNMATLAVMVAILLGFGFPADLVLGRMVPGTALGVLAGDLIYTWLAIRLAKRSGNPKTCAVPLGLDTPSSIGIIVCVLGPVFLNARQDGLSPDAAGLTAWNIGIATMLLIGIFKLIMSFCGSWIQRQTPAAALLGSLAGVGIALLGFMQLANLFTVPVAGLLSLSILFFSLIARMRLPFNFSGVLTAIIFGSIIYHIMGIYGINPGTYTKPPMEFYFHLPEPTLAGVLHLGDALKYITVSLPFAILTIIGGINVTASAHAEGDQYNTRSILMTEAFSTLVAGFFGGVAQTTPYAGFPAYKRMDARAGYTLLVGLFIGLGGILGYVSFIVELIPAAVLAPILIFLALEVTAQPYLCTPKRHAAAVGLAILPGLARLLSIYFSDPNVIPPDSLTRLMNDASGSGFPSMLIVFVLGNGFILTGMLWGGFMAEMIDHHFARSSIYLLICALLSLFGIIHSPYPNGDMLIPWKVQGLPQQIAWQFFAAYLITAIVIFLLSRKSTPECAPDAA